jgi:hypothetical protein
MDRALAGATGKRLTSRFYDTEGVPVKVGNGIFTNFRHGTAVGWGDARAAFSKIPAVPRGIEDQGPMIFQDIDINMEYRPLQRLE